LLRLGCKAVTRRGADYSKGEVKGEKRGLGGGKTSKKKKNRKIRETIGAKG